MDNQKDASQQAQQTAQLAQDVQHLPQQVGRQNCTEIQRESCDSVGLQICTTTSYVWCFLSATDTWWGHSELPEESPEWREQTCRQQSCKPLLLPLQWHQINVLEFIQILLSFREVVLRQPANQRHILPNKLSLNGIITWKGKLIITTWFRLCNSQSPGSLHIPQLGMRSEVSEVRLLK